MNAEQLHDLNQQYALDTDESKNSVLYAMKQKYGDYEAAKKLKQF